MPMLEHGPFAVSRDIVGIKNHSEPSIFTDHTKCRRMASDHKETHVTISQEPGTDVHSFRDIHG